MSSDASHLSKTVCLHGYSISTRKEVILEGISQYGTILDLIVEPLNGKLFCLVEFVSLENAERLISLARINVHGFDVQVSRSLRTCSPCIPPDVVFGKPLSIGLHVMATNPTNITGALRMNRENSLKRVSTEVNYILSRLSRTTPGIAEYLR